MIYDNLKLTHIRTIVICLIVLNIFNIAALYSSLHQGGELEQASLIQKQIIWIIISWLLLIIFSFINYRLYFDLGIVLYIISLVLLTSVFVFGKKIMGAQRWLSLGGMAFQPSELSKIAVIFILARIFSSEWRKNFIKGVIVPLCLVMVIAFLIVKQPDLGTALITIFIFFMMGLSSGIKKRYFIILIVLGLVLVPFGWHFIENYQRKRLIVFIDPNVDPLGAGYTIIQSKISIGSGKILGKGFLSGTQNQFNFLPERHTDFIFTVIAEEWGFMGSVFLLVIYWVILKTILSIAKGCSDLFGKILTLGIGSLFFLHVFINIGMTLGVLPVVGVPLIFLSYGGTHLVVTFILIGILFNVIRSL